MLRMDSILFCILVIMNRIKTQHHRNNQTHGQFVPRRRVDNGRLCAQDITGTGHLIKKTFFQKYGNICPPNSLLK